MRDVTLTEILSHDVAKKYLNRSGVAHAVTVAYHAFHLAKQQGVDVDAATKAGLLHDMGHYLWYEDGQWDYELYKNNDIHAIKGAERAHKLLIRLGEDPIKAKEIAVAILFHTDSFMPNAFLQRTPLQEVVKLADERDEEVGGLHHYRKMTWEEALESVEKLDRMIDGEFKNP